MNKLYTCIVLMLVIAISGCDKNFEEINRDPVSLTTLDPVYMFSNAQKLSVFRTVDYQASIVQHIATPHAGSLAGGNYNQSSDFQSLITFDTLYNGPIKLLVDIINRTKSLPARTNLYNMARIQKAYLFQILVDTYGAVPYFEAGKGYLEGIYLPKYDRAEDIYDDLIKELSEATLALDATKPIETQEIFYKGNIAQWKKLGNSILLRIAMRYSKIDAAKAKTNVLIATDPARGGVIESINDNTKVIFNNIFNNIFVERFHGPERGFYYLGAPFVEYLKTTNDPRLKEIAVKYQFPDNALGLTGTENTNPADQLGMPFGYNATTISTAPGFPGVIGGSYAYSQVNRRTITAINSTAFLVTASQTLLLLAEAAQRGWITGGAGALYNLGVKAHMDQFKQTISTSEIPKISQDAYLAANPFDPAKALEQINRQYWISSYTDWAEAWANFRRSDFPKLTPNPYPGADPDVKGAFIRRLKYPNRELSVNSANVNAAIKLQGPDNLSTRLFWDKP